MVILKPKILVQLVSFFIKLLPFEAHSNTLSTASKNPPQIQGLNESACQLMETTGKQPKDSQNINYFLFIINCIIICTEQLILPIIAIMVLVDIEPLFSTDVLMNYAWMSIILGVRSFLLIVYISNIIPRYSALYLMIKLLNYVSLFLMRETVMVALIVIEYLADVIYIVTKSQKSVHFDSRCELGLYMLRMLIIEVCVILYIFNGEQQIYKFGNLFFLFVGSICLSGILQQQMVFSFRLKRIQEKCGYYRGFYLFYLLVFKSLNEDDRYIEMWAYLVPLAIFIVIFLCTIALKAHECPPTIKYLSLDFCFLNQHYKKKYIWEAIYMLESAKYPQNQQELEVTFYSLLNKGSQTRNQNSDQLAQLKSQYPQQSYRQLYQQALQMMIYHESSNKQYFKLLSIFYKDGYMAKLLDSNLYQIIISSQNFIDGFYQARISSFYYQNKSGKKEAGLSTSLNQIYLTEQKIQGMTLEYADFFKKLIRTIQSPQIDLYRCQRLSKKIYNIQRRLSKYLTFSSQKNQRDPQSMSETQRNQSEKILQNSKVIPLSQTALQTLKLFKQNILGEQFRQNQKPNEFIKEITVSEHPILVVSGQKQKKNQIIAVNQAACKLTSYSPSQLIGHDLKILLSQSIYNQYHAMIDKYSKRYTNQQKIVSSLIHIIKKTGHCEICSMQVQTSHNPLGKKFYIRLEQKYTQYPIMVFDQAGKLISFNEKSNIMFNIKENQSIQLNNHLLESLVRDGQLSDALSEQICKAIPLSQHFDLKLIDPHQFSRQQAMPPMYYVRIEKNDLRIKFKNENLSIEQSIPKFYFSIENQEFTNIQIDEEKANREVSQYFANLAQVLAHEQNISPTNHKIKYDEDIDEVLYINGNVEFKENKTLEEIFEAQTYPPHTKSASKYRQFLLDGEMKLPVKQILKEIADKRCKNLQYPVKLMSLLIIGLILLLIGIGIFQLIIMNKQQSLEQKSLRIKTAYSKIQLNYIHISLLFSYPIWQQLNISAVYDMNIGDFELIQKHTQGHLREIQKIKKQIQLIDYDVYQYFHNYKDDSVNPQDSFGRIEENLLISIHNFFTTPKNDTLQQMNQIYERLITQIFPIYEKIMIVEKDKLQTEQELAQLLTKIALSIFGLLVLAIGLLTFYQAHRFNQIRYEFMKIFSGFSSSLLRVFQDRIEEVEEVISKESNEIVSLKDIEQFIDKCAEDDGGLLFHSKKIKNKDKILGFKVWQLRFLIIFVTVGLVIGGSLVYLMSLTKFETYKQIENLYLNSPENVNKLWLYKILAASRQPKGLDSAELLQQRIKRYQEQIPESVKNETKSVQISIVTSLFTEETQEKLLSIRKSSFCDKMTEVSVEFKGQIAACDSIFNDRFIDNLLEYYYIKRENVLKFYQYAYQKFKQGQTKIFEVINLQIFNRIEVYEGSLKSYLMNILQNEFEEKKEYLLLLKIILITLQAVLVLCLCVWSYLQIRKQNRELYQSISIITEIFPIFLLNSNWLYKKYYYEEGNLVANDK